MADAKDQKSTVKTIKMTEHMPKCGCDVEFTTKDGKTVQGNQYELAKKSKVFDAAFLEGKKLQQKENKSTLKLCVDATFATFTLFISIVTLGKYDSNIVTPTVEFVNLLMLLH